MNEKALNSDTELREEMKGQKSQKGYYKSQKGHYKSQEEYYKGIQRKEMKRENIIQDKEKINNQRETDTYVIKIQ